MKELTMFYFKGCPYCERAFRWQKELMEQHPELSKVPIRLIDEKRQPEIADKYDYYFVPTYYLDGRKLHEGVKSKELIEECFRRAYEGK